MAFGGLYLNANGQAAEDCWNAGLKYAINKGSVLLETTIWTYDTGTNYGRAYEYQTAFYLYDISK